MNKFTLDPNATTTEDARVARGQRLIEENRRLKSALRGVRAEIDEEAREIPSDRFCTYYDNRVVSGWINLIDETLEACDD